MVKNKARVEGSIANAYIVREASHFCSHYFEDHVCTRLHIVPRNDEGDVPAAIESNLSIFQSAGCLSGKTKKRRLSDDELKALHHYLMLNSVEIEPFIEKYVDSLRDSNPDITNEALHLQMEESFASWFEKHAWEIVDTPKVIRDMASGDKGKGHAEQTKSNTGKWKELSRLRHAILGGGRSSGTSASASVSASGSASASASGSASARASARASGTATVRVPTGPHGTNVTSTSSGGFTRSTDESRMHDDESMDFDESIEHENDDAMDLGSSVAYFDRSGRNMPFGTLALMIVLCSVFRDRRLEDDTPTGSHLLGMRRKEQRRCSHLYRNRGRSIGSHQSSWHPPSKTRKIGVAVTRMPMLAPRTPVVHCLFARLERALISELCYVCVQN
ncbi:unnamed protein product [Cuscuta campestris]|uniref:DUF4218 domain-containing protein n=1 Tax=Cuscuta campestris TaxID=132261 RepID=A0A484LZJ7_9ASTE|nr:unnamed protein product [Cuscuta campestris]